VKDLDGRRPIRPPRWPSSPGSIRPKLPAVRRPSRASARRVTGISKFVAIGLNYVDHAKETRQPDSAGAYLLPEGQTTTLSGRNDAVGEGRAARPSSTGEVEIAAIIGTRAKYVSEADALNHVAGYCICNDVSERNSQIERGGQWTNGKSHDTFGPVGTWAGDPRDEKRRTLQKLSMWLDVKRQARTPRPDRPRP